MKTVDDCQYITILNPCAGSLKIDSRLQRHFTTFAVALPSATSLLTIYQTFLDGHLHSQQFNPSVRLSISYFFPTSELFVGLFFYSDTTNLSIY